MKKVSAVKIIRVAGDFAKNALQLHGADWPERWSGGVA